MQENTVTYNIAEVFNPQDSVFVSANAGAGKTSLLTNRVLALLLHGVPPSKILCLTFTNAAAAEMANRVQSELGNWVMASDEALATKITHLNLIPDVHTLSRARSLFAQVLESPEGVRIQTLHGLCQSLLRRFPVEAGISPHFSIMDTRTEQEIMHEARQRLFTRAQSHDQALRDAIQTLTQSQGEESFRQLLETIIRNRRAILPLFSGHTRTETATALVWNLLNVTQGSTIETLIDTHFSYTDNNIATLRAIAAQLLSGEPKPTDAKTGQGLATWLEKQSTRASIIADYIPIFLTAENTPRKKIYTNAALTDATLIDSLMTEQARVLTYANAANAHAIATRTGHMLTIADALLSLYTSLKTSRALMDYEDLIMSAVDLLGRQDVIPWVLYKLDGGIDHLLVDEAQDTSPEQWSIIDALTGEFFSGQGRAEQDRSLFVVGDEKQSIFSFQGADPRELGKARERFVSLITAAGKKAHTVELTRSFRSTGSVLQAVDAVFAHPAAREGLTYSNSGIFHILHRDAPGMVELWPPFLREKKEDAESQDTISTNIKLARSLADTIKDWLDTGLMLESKKRPVQPGDIMILVRTRSRFVDPLVRALKRNGVPVSGHDRMKLQSNLAIQDLIACGQCILLPEDDLTLAALLKSPLFALTEHELFQLAHNREKQSLWERLQSLHSLNETTAHAYSLLTDLRARADYISPFELYSYLLENRAGRARITGRMGEEYHDPLDEFLGLALQYERAHTPSLQGFIHWLTASKNDEIKRDMEQVQNCVRILTVHASKGLEAPIVILPDTTKKPESKNTLLWHEGQGFRLPFWPGDSKSDDPFCASLRQTRKATDMGEYRRLLYVALTRARDRLYICGAANAQKVSEESWYDLIHTGLSQIAIPFQLPWGDGYRLGDMPDISDHENVDLYPSQIAPEFDYLSRPAPSDPVPPQPLAPSRLAGEEPAAASPLNALGLYTRGTIIHQLLQYLPQAPAAERARLAKKLTQTLPEAERDATISEVMRVITHPDHAFLFTPQALAEVPVAGLVTVSGRKVAVSGQIDRLHIGEEAIWIVDFKSNHTPPSTIPTSYIRQLRLYQLLLQQIYPKKRIVCALLWTATATISTVPQSLLDEVPASSYI